MTKSRLLVPVLAAAALLLSGIPAASAHGAAPPPSYVTRLLSDYSDDWLGVQDGHNVIALDGYTQYNATLGGDVVVFRFILDGGYARANSANPELAEHVTFKANGKDQELAIHTEDNQEFSSEVGFAAVRGPFVQTTADGATPDGTRFYVEGLVPFGNLSIKAGDALSGFYVQGEAGAAEGDAMPQDALVPGSDASTLPDPNMVEADIGSWTVLSPSHYLTATLTPADDPVKVPVVGDVVLDLALANTVTDTAQSVMAMASGEGVLVSFSSAPAAKDAMGMLDLAAGKSGKLSIHVSRAPAATAAMGNASASSSLSGSGSGSASHTHAASTAANATAAPADMQGLLTLNITTSLGGHIFLPIRLVVAQPAPVPAANSTTEHTHAAAKKSPGPAIPALAGALGLVAVVLRRRKSSP